MCDSTNHCVLPDASLPDSSPGDAADDAGDAGTDGPIVTDAGTLIFDEEFDGGTIDTTNKWVVMGDGTWTITNGYGEQTNGNAKETLMYAKNFTTATDYHIVARMHSTGPFIPNQDLAPEICFRTDPSVITSGIPQTYHCNMDLYFSQLIIQSTAPVPGDLATTNLSLPGNFNDGTWFVLDAVVSGSNVTCTVTVDGLGLIGTVSTTQASRLAGSFGLKTYDTAAEFQYIRVYAVP